VVHDPKDAHGVLDLRRIEVYGKKRPIYKVFTWRSWKAEQIWDRGYGFVYFDTYGSRRADFYALIRANGNALEASLWQDRTKRSDRYLSALDVWRPNPRSLAVRVPVRKLRFSDTRVTYRWYVKTVIAGPKCPRQCFDRAPDTGTIEAPIPGRPLPVPSPSASPTP
jgi:hypothetical protein